MRANKTLSVAQVAERLDIHETTIQRWIRQRHFPNAHKKGPGKTSPYIVPESDVAAFIEARRQEQAAKQK
jgi:excisionase family DNA binding protein